MFRSTVLLCFIAWTMGASVTAQAQIHRCIGADGRPVFTDQICAAVNATPVRPAAAQSTPAASAPLPVLCAATPEALRQAVIDAFAAGNANRLAGLMLWGGYGQRGAIADLRSLDQWMKQPLLEVRLPGEPASDGNMAAREGMAGLPEDPFALRPAPAPTPRLDQLIVRTAGRAGSDETQQRRFRVVHQSGCLWLREAR